MVCTTSPTADNLTSRILRKSRLRRSAEGEVKKSLLSGGDVSSDGLTLRGASLKLERLIYQRSRTERVKSQIFRHFFALVFDCAGKLAPPRGGVNRAAFPEKWWPVFRKDHAPKIMRQRSCVMNHYRDCGGRIAQPTWSVPSPRWNGRSNGAPISAAGATAARFGGSTCGSLSVHTKAAPRARRSARSIQGARSGSAVDQHARLRALRGVVRHIAAVPHRADDVSGLISGRLLEALRDRGGE